MSRTPEEFQRAAAERGITHWNIRSCSVCATPLHYLFHDGHVEFQGGCGCRWDPPQVRSWDDVARHYNMQSAQHVVDRYDEFWGFTPWRETATSG